jgi:hypothetical protein
MKETMGEANLDKTFRGREETEKMNDSIFSFASTSAILHFLQGALQFQRFVCGLMLMKQASLLWSQ